MDIYHKTKEDYDLGAAWHFIKSLSYNWSKQLGQFTQALEGKKVLDAGCGIGRDINFFLSNKIDIEGVDYSEAAIKKCRLYFPGIKFYISDIRKIAVPDNYYDGVWACASVLNISKNDLPAVLHEFLRILKIGGSIFVSVKEGLGEKLIPDKYGERIFSFYSENELKKIFINAGFKITYSEIVTDESLTGVALDKSNWICIYGKKISNKI